MHSFREWVTSSGALFWAGIFLAVNLAFPLAGGTNADSRHALLVALAEDGTYRLDSYRDRTSDWARTPDGRYYSNKAPGPSLVAFPIFWVMDKVMTRGAADRAGRDAIRFQYKGRVQKWLSFFFQLLPFSLLLIAAGHFLKQRGASPAAANAALFALAFGTTASLFFNTYFGHAVAAAALLGFFLAALSEKPWLAGFALGLAVLCDYGMLAVLPAVLLALFPARKQLGGYFLGALAPAVAWVLYHQKAFGSPFALASKFQNPEFVGKHALWGILSKPDPEIFVKLIAGPERGLLWTQPWLLVLLPVALLLALREGGEKKKTAKFALLGLFGLLVLNASFNGWHGGLVPGPRYLTPILPIWALFLGLVWDELTDKRRKLVTLGLAVSGAVAVLVFSSGLSTPTVALWPHLLHQTLKGTPTAKIRFALLATLIALTVLWRNRRKGIGWTPWQKPSSESV